MNSIPVNADMMHIVTKTKNSCVVFEKPPAKKQDKGRPRKKASQLNLKFYLKP
jgi:hypothetical protein